MPVYLLHSTVPLVRASGSTVRHYLGYCEPGNLLSRVEQHRKGRSSNPMVQAMVQRGGRLLIGNYYPLATRTDERRWKRNGHLSDRCLVCGLRKAIDRFDALRSLVRGSSSTSSGHSPEPAENSRRRSTAGAAGRMAGSLRLARRLQYTVYRARRWRYRGDARGGSD